MSPPLLHGLGVRIKQTDVEVDFVDSSFGIGIGACRRVDECRDKSSVGKTSVTVLAFGDDSRRKTLLAHRHAELQPGHVERQWLPGYHAGGDVVHKVVGFISKRELVMSTGIVSPPISC